MELDKGQAMKLSLTLPYPPTANTLYATYRGRRLLSKRGKDYVKLIAKEVLASRAKSFGTSRLLVDVLVIPPDKRKRDLGNLDKVLMDSLQKAGLFEDDSQIDDLRFRRLPSEKPGRVEVTIEVIEDYLG